MLDFENYACWQREDAESVLATLATEDADAVFLARHTPISGFRIEAANEINLPQSDEESLLQALLRRRRHALVVVEGEPGSGKSHLIRWLKIRWPERAASEDQVVLIPKSKSTLGRTLQFLRERMPAKYRDVFDDVQTAESFLSGEGRVHELVNKLALALDPECVTDRVRLEHAEWAGRTGAAELLQVPRLGKTWKAPRRIVDAYSDPDAPAEKRQFSLADVRDLVVTVRDRRGFFGHRAKSLFAHLDRELRWVQGYVREGRGLAQLQKDERESIEASANLLEALNSRLRYAIQLSIGVRPDQLRKAFEDLRVRLAADKKRLVLLLEDITDFQGLDNQLIEALIQRAGDAGEVDLCPLVAVIGITPGFYNDYLVQMNYLRDRIALHVSLSEGAGLQDTISLKSDAARHVFAARYLNTIRLGVPELEGRLQGSSIGILPSACSSCEHRSPCHEVFGATTIQGVDDEVGLYPLTRQALDTIYGHLKDPEGTGSLKTPRGLIQNVLGPILRHPAALEEGRFPTSHLGSTQLRERGLGGNVRSVTSSLAERDRVERFVTWWGNPRGAAFGRTERGDPIFGGVARLAFEVFGMTLPWDGAPVVPPPSGPSTGPQPPKPPDVAGPTPPVPPPELAEDPEFDGHLDALGIWFGGGAIEGEHEVFWAIVLRQLIDSLPWAALGFPEALRRAVFGERGVLLVGTRRSPSVFQLQVGPVHGRDDLNTTLQLGLEGWVRLRENRPLEGQTSAHQSDVARLLDWLGCRVKEHVAGLPTTVGGVAWEPTRALVRSLVYGLWLAFAVDPEAEPERLWAAILNSEFRLVSGGRSPEWREAAFELFSQGKKDARTLPPAERKRRLLLLLRMPGDYRGTFYDAGTLARCLVAMLGGETRGGCPSQFPRAWKSEGEIALLEPALEAALLAAVSAEEQYRLERVGAINERLQGRALDDFLDSADRVIERFRKEVDHRVVANDRVERWRRALGKLDKALEQTRQEFLADFDLWIDPDSAQGQPRNGDLPARMGWCYRWPTEWARVPSLVEDAHKLLEAFHAAAERVVDSDGGSGGRAELTEGAARLRRALEGLRKAVGSQ